jgi:hypothetical protein
VGYFGFTSLTLRAGRGLTGGGGQVEPGRDHPLYMQEVTQKEARSVWPGFPQEALPVAVLGDT